jgi:hypothetical protein
MEDEMGLPASAREILADAPGFWEPRRVIYNLVLALCVAGWFVATWPHFRGALTLAHLFDFSILAILANICYTAGDLLDFLMQLSSQRAQWQRSRRLFWAGETVLAVLLANDSIADEIDRYVGR